MFSHLFILGNSIFKTVHDVACMTNTYVCKAGNEMFFFMLHVPSVSYLNVLDI